MSTDDGFPIPGTTTPRVDAVIAAVMKRFPGQTPSAQARYFDAVHQELAPFARELELESARLSAALAEKSAQLEEERARNAWQHISTAPANHEVLACNAAGYVGRAVLLKGKWEHIGMPTHWMPLPSLPTDTSKETP